MTNKKELSLEELDSITGGIWSNEAQCYFILNWDKISERFKDSKDSYMMFIDAVISRDGSKKIYGVQDAKDLLGLMFFDTSKFIDYDPNNPEHVKKVNG